MMERMKLELRGVLGWMGRVAFNAALNKSLWCKENPVSCFSSSLFHLIK